MSRRFAAIRVAVLLFGSGFCALIYQIAWLRQLRLVFGASTAASAAVLAIFMGGLGLGALRLSRRAQGARSLRFYSRLELGIALCAAATPWLVDLSRLLYAALGGTAALGPVVGTIVRLLLTALVLGLPTFFMGGTLPAAIAWVQTDRDARRSAAAFLYAGNTLGAVAGSAVGTLILIEAWGTKRMLLGACALNLLIAYIARSIAVKTPESLDGSAPAELPARGAEPTPPGAPLEHRSFVLFVAGMSGAIFLLMEIVWYRMLGPLLGGSSYAFGIILSVALLGIGLGSLVYAAIARIFRATLAGLSLACAACALAIGAPFALGDRIAVWIALLRPGAVTFADEATIWAAMTGLVVLPAAFFSGLQFPLVLSLLGSGRRQVGQDLGMAYGCNTVGAIVGSLAGGFGLLPLLGAPAVWRAVIVALVGVALVTAILAARDRSRLTIGSAVLVMGLGLVLASARGPTAGWRHSGIGVLPWKRASPIALTALVHRARRAIVWQTDGVESSVALDREDGLAFVLNGNMDGTARADSATQVMGGLIGAVLHPGPKSALVIGLGTGSTAGWLASVPSIERVDVAELERAMLHVTGELAAINHRLLDNRRAHIAVGDARELLTTSRARYDLIFSEPSHPYRAGVSSLYTVEFYRAVANHLADGGIFTQWIQAYQISQRTLEMVYATLSSVFPTIETWSTMECDLMLVARRGPVQLDAAAIARRITEEPFASALRNAWRVTDLEGFFARYVAGPSVAIQMAESAHGRLCTDDRPLVEFDLLRAAGKYDERMKVTGLRELARAAHADRPPLALVDPDRRAERFLSALAAQQSAPGPLPGPRSPTAGAYADVVRAWVRGDLRAAAAALHRDPLEPTDPMERLIVAEAQAETADDAAPALIAQVAAEDPTEAEILTARLELRRGQLAAATASLERAVVRYRADPWPLESVMKRGLSLALEIARARPELGQLLYAALAVPFVASLLDGERRETRIRIAELVDPAHLCAEAFAAEEPEVPWDRDFLQGRWNCYRAVHDRRAAAAERDLALFEAQARAQERSVGH